MINKKNCAIVPLFIKTLVNENNSVHSENVTTW